MFDDFKTDNGLLYRTEGDPERNHVEINVTMWNGSREFKERNKGADQVLAGLVAIEVLRDIKTAWDCNDLIAADSTVVNYLQFLMNNAAILLDGNTNEACANQHNGKVSKNKAMGYGYEHLGDIILKNKRSDLLSRHSGVKEYVLYGELIDKSS